VGKAAAGRERSDALATISEYGIPGRSSARAWNIMTAAVVAIMVGALGWLFVRSNSGAGGPAPVPAMFENGVDSLASARAEAGNDGLVFAFATADWCGPCQQFKRNALVDPAVEEWVRANATPVYIDVDQNQRDAEALQVRGIPQTTLMTGDGKVLVREVGAMSADQLLAVLRAAVKK
jgi:thiol:disulfide interchange protein